MPDMSTQFYSVPSAVQNAMGGTHLHTPQSIFQHTMSHQSTTPQNESQWLRMPQVPPMSMPWSIPSFQQPDLVRFTGERPLQPFGPLVHQKRKLETPDVVDTRPTKQFITEEKMAQHFRGLYISPNAANAQDPGPSTSAARQSTGQFATNAEMDMPNTVDADENNDHPRLVISEELKRLQQEPILPSSLLSKLERPSMALVLWEPPNKHLRILPTPRDTPTPIPSSDDSNNNGMDVSSINNNNNNNNNNSNNNNNESIPNLNQTMDVNISDPTLEPMDL
ncbi:probable WRKY transcription factor protein 1 isoform X1 [Nasonia vitripennis]|uniref:Uncharacterized protein n=2 Tax=Nasonia vitripennis TaxID=7425 RepID=A0A7M7QAA5_NASVI|nr:probable WRKY transcription factor protein 1 isoform X1 [Nasonia vitripennis]